MYSANHEFLISHSTNKNLQCQILTSHTKPIKFPTYVNNISEKGILKISYLVQVIYFQAILKESYVTSFMKRCYWQKNECVNEQHNIKKIT